KVIERKRKTVGQDATWKFGFSGRTRTYKPFGSQPTGRWQRRCEGLSEVAHAKADLGTQPQEHRGLGGRPCNRFEIVSLQKSLYSADTCPKWRLQESSASTVRYFSPKRCDTSSAPRAAS